MTSRKTRLTIQPFKYVSMSEVTLEQAQKSWEKLEKALVRIFAREHQDLSFEELYRTAYNLVLHRYGELLYEGLERGFHYQAQLVRSTVQSRAHRSEVLLESLRTRWQLYKNAVRTVRDVFMYADRSFIRSTGRTPVYELGMSAFRDDVLRDQTFATQLVDAMLDVVTRSRLGEQPPLTLLRDTLDMYIELDMYAEAFEGRFLRVSREFYTLAAARVLQTCSGRSYLQHVREWFLFEEKLANECLAVRTTRTALQTLLGEILLSEHLNEILDTTDTGFLQLLQSQRLEDLQMMYDLLIRIPEGVDAMRGRLAPYVREKVRADLVRGASALEQPLEWVARAMHLKDEFYNLLAALQMDPKFVRAVQEGFEEALNECPCAQEFLSLYIDKALRESPSISREATRAALEHASGLFRLLRNKDVFEQHYKVHLSRRLLRRFASNTVVPPSANDDAEQHFISKLREECGAVYTAKLEAILQDMRTSDELNAAYRRHQEMIQLYGSRARPMLQVCVITNGIWPVAEAPTAQIPACHPELVEITQEYEKFYHERHAKRRLQWLLHQGSAELCMRLSDEGPALSLKVTSLQMLILLLFNNAEALTVQEMLRLLQFPGLSPELMRALRALCDSRHAILVRAANGPVICNRDVFRVNKAFQSTTLDIDLTDTDHVDENAGVERAARSSELLERDRRPEITACVMRILKRRQELEHSQLVAQVIDELHNRFVPTVAEVKREIEALLEREYIARESDELTVYRYIP